MINDDKKIIPDRNKTVDNKLILHAVLLLVSMKLIQLCALNFLLNLGVWFDKSEEPQHMLLNFYMFTVGSLDRSFGRYSGRYSVDTRSI